MEDASPPLLRRMRQCSTIYYCTRVVRTAAAFRFRPSDDDAGGGGKKRNARGQAPAPRLEEGENKSAPASFLCRPNAFSRKRTNSWLLRIQSFF